MTGEARMEVDLSAQKSALFHQVAGYGNSTDPVRLTSHLADALDELRMAEQQLRRQNEALIHLHQKLQSLAEQVLLAEERERRRIAAELHDRVAQSLALARIKLEAARQQSLPTARSLDEVVQLIDGCIRDTRSLMFDLSPPVLYELGFAAALQWMARKIEHDHQLRVTLDGTLQEELLDEPRRVSLFQAVRELLLNVARHAYARNVHIVIRQESGELRISVSDDGIGFSPAQSSGFGLFSIRQRLEHLAGRMEVRSAPGQGASVLLAVPLTEASVRGATSAPAPADK